MGTGPTGTTTLGSYRLLEELGAGAMGTVWRAEDGDRQVALKLIHAHLLGRHGFFQRFQREAQAGRKVDHPNVVRTLECDLLFVDDEPHPFLVMEYVQGRTLRELLRDLGTVPEGLVREIGRQVAEGLAAIHDAGLVHRDLKPENVLITDDQRVRIMDLGVARHTERSSALTKEGQFAGSLLYAAPEQFRGANEVGPAADLYALGVVLYELVSGVNPFRHDEMGAVVKAHLDCVPERLDRRNDESTFFLSEVVATLLAKDADERFESASALAEVFVGGEGSAWWQGRERALREDHERRVRVPVRRETELYGRETERALLADAWQQARDGRGNAVLVEGEAGIGKSRLVDAFLADAGDASACVLYGSYAPSGGMGAISDALLSRFAHADLEDALRPYLAVTPSLVPALAAVLRREPPPEGAPTLAGDALHAVLVHLMRALAREKPLLWVIEDLHFAEADSRELVLSLARAVANHPALLLLTTRPTPLEEELGSFSRFENLKRVNPGRLSAREVILLLQDAFRSERLADKLGARIALKSDGVPFFVFEMIRGLREGLFITQLPDGSWIETKVIEDIEVPSAVRGLIETRLMNLTKAERAILEVGAVLGFEFDPDLVARVLDRPRVAVLQDAADIERRSGVLRAAGESMRFDHHQIQEVLYEDLIPALCREYHSLLARVFAERGGARADTPAGLPGQMAVFLAQHGLKGCEPRDGIPYLDPALRHLASSYRGDETIALADLALQVDGLLAGTERLELLLRKNDCLHLLGRRAEQEAVLAEARSVAEEKGEKASLACVGLEMGRLLYRTGRPQRAKEILERSVATFREISDRQGEAHATGILGGVFHALDRYEDSRAHCERVLEIAREIGDRWGEANATGNLGVLSCERGRYEEARQHFERVLEITREIGDRWGEASTTGNIGGVLDVLGRFEDAKAYLERYLEIAREIGDRRGEAKATGDLGGLLTDLGRPEEAMAHHERQLAMAREIGDRRCEVNALTGLGDVFHALGDYEEARRHFELSLAIFREIGGQVGAARALVALARLHAEQGRLQESQESLEEALALGRKLDAPCPVVLALCHLGALPQGDAAPALSAFRDYVGRLEHTTEIEARFLLWRAAHDGTHLVEARRLLDHLVEHAPEEYRESMLVNVTLHREIMAASTRRSTGDGRRGRPA